MKSYGELFGLRGSSYDRAMQRFPSARDQEFRQALGHIELRPGMVVGDVPCGGGYLRHYLPEGVIWIGHDPCSSFEASRHPGSGAANTSFLPLPWPDASVDAAISLAGTHHMEDKIPFFAELFRIARPGARLVISDVYTGSAVETFLEGYVNSKSSTGHRGTYLGNATLKELMQAGWSVESSEHPAFQWMFPDFGAMADFCQELFDLRNCTREETLAAIADILGTTSDLTAGVGMNWSLMTISATR